jgi:hypothetical protein
MKVVLATVCKGLFTIGSWRFDSTVFSSHLQKSENSYGFFEAHKVALEKKFVLATLFPSDYQTDAVVQRLATQATQGSLLQYTCTKNTGTMNIDTQSVCLQNLLQFLPFLLLRWSPIPCHVMFLLTLSPYIVRIFLFRGGKTPRLNKQSGLLPC